MSFQNGKEDIIKDQISPVFDVRLKCFKSIYLNLKVVVLLSILPVIYYLNIVDDSLSSSSTSIVQCISTDLSRRLATAHQAHHQLLDTYLRKTQPKPLGGAVQYTWTLVRLRGVPSVTAGGQLVINCVSSSSII